MITILIKTTLESEDFRTVTAGGELRSDLLRLVGERADRCRFWREKPTSLLTPESGSETALTPALLAEFSADRSGRWNFYGVQLFSGERLLLSAGRFGSELILFGPTGERAKELLTVMEEYDEVKLAKVFPEPTEVLARCAGRVV